MRTSQVEKAVQAILGTGFPNLFQVRASQVQVSTRPFYTSNLKQPSGRGGWAFCPARNWNDANYLDSVFWFNGLYSEAKKAAQEHFAAKGELAIVVCS